MASLTCPSCSAVLKTKDPVPAGKKVKCPKCATVFESPGEEQPTEAPPTEADENAFADLAGGPAEEKPKKKAKSAATPPAESSEAADDGAEKSDVKGKKADGKNNKMIISLVVAAVLLFCCCPGVCGTVYSIFAGAINAAIGIGAAAQQKKALDDLQKAKLEFENKAKK